MYIQWKGSAVQAGTGHQSTVVAYRPLTLHTKWFSLSWYFGDVHNNFPVERNSTALIKPCFRDKRLAGV